MTPFVGAFFLRANALFRPGDRPCHRMPLAAMRGRMEGVPSGSRATGQHILTSQSCLPHWTSSMLDPDRRKKMISLRLSEEEFELLKARYHTYGARNVSDLARQALQHIMTGSPGPKPDLAAEMAELNQRVHELESRVSLLQAREKVVS